MMKQIQMPPAIDVCCGGRMFWTDKKDPRAIYMDIRELGITDCGNGQLFSVAPDVIGDFTNNPYPDNTFSCVIFDPPHLRCGEKSFMFKKYGTLGADWKEVISKGFSECFRILVSNGSLIFKWSDSYKNLSEILELTTETPLITHTTKSRSGIKRTHFCVFIKG